MTEKYCDRKYLSVGTSVMLPNVVYDERKSSDPDTQMKVGIIKKAPRLGTGREVSNRR